MTNSYEDMSLVLRAFTFAAHRHRNQRRKGGEASPYINHLIDVADLLWNIGEVRDCTTITAGILHDVIEDTPTSEQELEGAFGIEIVSIVREVTDDKSLSKPVRKRLQVEHAARLSHPARLIKLADKISNITDILEFPPSGWSEQQRREYVDWGKAVIDRIRGTNEGLERYFDELYERAKSEIGET